jgi:hypothetical protein
MTNRRRGDTHTILLNNDVVAEDVFLRLVGVVVLVLVAAGAGAGAGPDPGTLLFRLLVLIIIVIRGFICV